EIAGDDPELLLMLAIIELRGSDVEDGLAIVRGLLEQDVSRGQQIVRLGVGVAERWPDTGFRVVEVVSDAAIARGDWTAAAAALQQFVSSVPYHVPSLMRLVEICVDGALDAMMTTAQ